MNIRSIVGKQQPPRRAALGLYTEGLSTSKLLRHCSAQRLMKHTSLTWWAFTRWRDQHTSDKVAHYSIYRPQMDERLSWPSWLTYSGRLTHISGEWSPVSCRSSVGQGKFTGQRPAFYHCATQPTNNNNNNIHICIAPYGRNFRGAGGIVAQLQWYCTYKRRSG